MSEGDARGAWGPLAERPERCRLSMGGGEPLTVDTRLIEDAEGRPTWVVDRVFHTESGVWVVARHGRTTGNEVEDVTLFPAADPDELVATLRGQGLLDPGMVETLGRAGIEIGLEPGEEVMD